MRRLTVGLICGALILGAGVMSGAQRDQRDPGPVLTRDNINKRDWVLQMEIQLRGVEPRQKTVRRINETGRIAFDNARVVFPVIGSSAAHDAHVERFAYSMYLAENELDQRPRVIKGYQGGTSIAVMELGQTSVTSMTLRMDIYTTSYETRIDEKRAMEIEWPEGEWSPEIASCLEAQIFVAPGDPEVKKLVERWTNGQPRKAKPYYLAKYLAGQVLEHTNLVDGWVGTAPRSWRDSVNVGVASLEGIWLREIGGVAKSGRGSPMDMVNLLCSVYRAAGLPARVVIAEDHEQSHKNKQATIHAWVEFYIFDERYQRGEWIPVDIIHQREFGSRAPNINQRWQHFGHSEEFDFMVPFAFHWVPPTAVRSPGPAGMWGWVVSPADPVVSPSIRVDSMETPKRGGESFPDPPKPIGM